MRTLILSVMDWDVTWLGLGRLRPQRREDSLSGRAIAAIVGYTSLFALLLILGLHFVVAGVGQPLAALQGQGTLTTVAAVLLPNAFLQVGSAFLWNHRAADLRSRFALSAEQRNAADSR
jgi:hypothetical protein